MSTRTHPRHRKPATKSRVAMLRDPLDDLEAFDDFVTEARREANGVIGDLRRTGFFRPVGAY